MRFLADECCDAPLVKALRKDGHDVLYAMEQLRGATDEHLEFDVCSYLLGPAGVRLGNRLLKSAARKTIARRPV
jgi:hypothetical protein